MDLGLSRTRSATLLVACTTLLTGSLTWAAHGHVPSRGQGDPPTFGTILEATAGWVLVAAVGWLTAMSLALLVEAFTGEPAAPRWCAAPRVLRRLVAVSSGAALAAGLAAPALATVPGDAARSAIDGVPLPERVVGAPATRPADLHVVSGGESLWLLARRLDPTADPATLADLVRRLHHTNREVIGPDPDVLLPGQRLRLPAGEER